MLGISHVTYYIPSAFYDITTSDSHTLHLSQEDVQLFSEEYGFKKIPVEREKSLSEMIIAAVRDNQEILKQKITRVVFVHANPESLQDFKRVMFSIKNLLGYKDICGHSLSQLNCTSFHGALKIIDSFIKTSPKQEGVLLITADKVNSPLNHRIPHSLMGDGVAVAFLSNRNLISTILATHVSIDPRTYYGIFSTPEQLKWFDMIVSLSVRKAIYQALETSSLHLNDIKIFLVSNINTQLWKQVSKKINQPVSKFFLSTISSMAHLYTSDILINFQCAREKGYIETGDYFMTISVGLGSAIGCSIHHYQG